MASAMTSPEAKLAVMREAFNTESAHLAINNILSGKKLSEGQKAGIKTTVTDLFFIIRNEGSKEDFANERRESFWQALEYLRGATNLKFFHAELTRSMEGFRPGVLDIVDETSIEDLGLDNDSDHDGDDGAGSIDGSDDDDGVAGQDEQPFKSILEPTSKQPSSSGSYLYCPDKDDKTSSASKRKHESSALKQGSGPKKAHLETASTLKAASAVGTFKAFSAGASRHPIGIEISGTNKIWLRAQFNSYFIQIPNASILGNIPTSRKR